jgi:hypothetical protein
MKLNVVGVFRRIRNWTILGAIGFSLFSLQSHSGLLGARVWYGQKGVQWSYQSRNDCQHIALGHFEKKGHGYRTVIDNKLLASCDDAALK